MATPMDLLMRVLWMYGALLVCCVFPLVHLTLMLESLASIYTSVFNREVPEFADLEEDLRRYRANGCATKDAFALFLLAGLHPDPKLRADVEEMKVCTLLASLASSSESCCRLMIFWCSAALSLNLRGN